MAHQAQVNFLKSVKQTFPERFVGCSVLDIGSLDINGNTRFLFDKPKYTGIDVGEGPNVDFVCKGHEFVSEEKFDIVISTECFEHDMYYKETLKNCVKLCKPGGMFLFTCASTGRAEHGTRRTSPSDAPLLQGEWSDYYKNLTEEDVREVLDIEDIFSTFQFFYEPIHKDLYFWGIKKNKLKIWTHIAWDHTNQKDIGKAYNECLKQHPDTDWLAIIDHDAVFTTNDWHPQLLKVIEDNPNCKGLTGRVNRMATEEQMVLGIDPNNMDYTYHRRVGKYLSKKYYGQSNCIKTPGHFSGTFFAVQIGTMKRLGGFDETGEQLGCDNHLQAKIVNAGYEFRVCNGIYIFHWYRFDDPYPHSKQVMEQVEQIHYNQLKLT